MRAIAIILLAIGLTFFSSYQPAHAASKCQKHLRDLAKRSPSEEAQNAVRSGTPYLLGIRDYSVWFPGVEGMEAAKKIGYRILEGTGDSMGGRSCRKYQREAAKYARAFNQRVLRLISNPQDTTRN